MDVLKAVSNGILKGFVKRILKGVLKDFPLVKFLEDWVGTFIGTQEDINIEQVSTTSSRKNSAGNKKK